MDDSTTPDLSMDVTTVGGGLVLDTTNVLSFVLRKINWWERWRSADGDSNYYLSIESEEW